MLKRNLYITTIFLLFMQEILDELAIKLCENLPLDFTLYEKDGFCRKSNKDCDFCRKDGGDSYLCNKKLYTLNQELRFV